MSNNNDHMINARTAFEQGNIVLAVNTIEQISNYNSNPDAIYLLALCHAVSNQYSTAERLFKKTLSLTRATDVIYGNLGLAQLHQGKLTDSIQSFLSAININPNHYDSIRNLTSAYDHINDSSNAIKYADSNKKDNNLIMTINVTKRKADITIKDNGIGIEKDILPKIFEMFYRGHESSKGSGIGLYLVKQAVDKMEGSIDVKSIINIGTEFKIIIPNAL